MQNNRKIAICLMVCAGGLLPTHAYGIDLSNSASWGQAGYVSDYYSGDEQQNCFQMEDNMFNYGETFVQDMGSTSAMTFGEEGEGQFSTVAESIDAGSTVEEYQYKTQARRIGKNGGHWEPPTEPVPVGDGWDVYLLMTTLAAVAGFFRWRKNSTKQLNA
ncbi:MAG: hypothetical protein MJZ75_02130 [Paludibacteraceae bacterium]|nr:hypothetical protein [Paludibacteraceae bacterium]